MHEDRLPWSRAITFLHVVLIGLWADLATKNWIFADRGMPFEKSTTWLVDGVLGFTTSLNEGTLFSLGQGATPIFAALSVATVLVIPVWMFYYRAAESWLLTLAGSLVMSGALGNLYDRLGLHRLRWNFSNDLHQVGEPVYAVRDWIDFRLIEWPIFNLADSFIVVGTALFALHILLAPSHEESPVAWSSEKASSPAP